MFGVIGQEGARASIDADMFGRSDLMVLRLDLVENGRTICIVNSQHIKVLFRIWKPDSKLALQQVVNKVVH